MTENAETIGSIIGENHDELLKAIITSGDSLYELENISIQAQLYQGISPRLCRDPAIMSYENLVKLQNYCRQIYDQRASTFYTEIADTVCFLLNENVPFHHVLSFSYEKLQKVYLQLKEAN